jgi:anaerobic selenocysteine-containing dehydrogenase
MEMKSSSWAFLPLTLVVGLIGATAGAVAAVGGRDHPPSQVRPMQACRAALPGEHVVSAQRTTVGAVRTWGYGGPIQHRPLRTAFAAAPAPDQALWCWTRESARRVTAYAVHHGYAARAISVVGPGGGTPRGAPLVP